MTTDDKMMIGIISGMCKDLIEKSKKRYENGSKYGKLGGRPTRYDPQTIKQMHQEGQTFSQIAEALGCAVRTVQRAIEKEEEI
jgi:DNA invertase Pin-like site-specific DNA recombinase